METEHENKVLFEDDLADRFDVARRTIRRMIQRGELPRPFRMNGKSAWLAEHVDAHIRERAERAVKEGQRQRAKIHRAFP